ncbi:hypothetical protein SASPL_152524 [Salvia splendens]|uniref:Uncharacterized protein n=1 Tax=Salvia splendens TaxID=180675 RepID=A0A8X8W378_SALSN|nr:hypothetical protein SASPL_152524 [Salvia splendens]
MATFEKLARADYELNYAAQDQGVGFFKSLLEIVSDEICNKASSCVLKAAGADAGGIEEVEAEGHQGQRDLHAGGAAAGIEQI